MFYIFVFDIYIIGVIKTDDNNNFCARNCFLLINQMAFMIYYILQYYIQNNMKKVIKLISVHSLCA